MTGASSELLLGPEPRVPLGRLVIQPPPHDPDQPDERSQVEHRPPVGKREHERNQRRRRDAPHGCALR